MGGAIRQSGKRYVRGYGRHRIWYVEGDCIFKNRILRIQRELEGQECAKLTESIKFEPLDTELRLLDSSLVQNGQNVLDSLINAKIYKANGQCEKDKHG